MDRKQRRTLARRMKGFSEAEKEVLQAIINYKGDKTDYSAKVIEAIQSLPGSEFETVDKIRFGDRVKINADRIFMYDSDKHSIRFVAWVMQNKDKVFTVQDEGMGATLVSLIEDETDPKWIFSIADLEKA